MDNILNDDTSNAVASVLRESLVDGHGMTVPGLGTFRVVHESSSVSQRHDGLEVMLPPRDVVAFEQEAETR